MSHEESITFKLENGLLHYNNGNVSGRFNLTRHFGVNGAKYKWGHENSTVTFQSEVTTTKPSHSTYPGQGIFKIADHKVANKLMVSINLANFYGTNPTLKRDDDPFRLGRFTEKYTGPGFKAALREIRGGKKEIGSHWFWWFVPTPPLLDRRGVEVGSKTNQIYAIRDAFSIEGQNSELKMDGHMHAAVAFVEHRVCLQSYNLMIDAIKYQLENRNNLNHLLGEVDNPKLVASLLMFIHATVKKYDEFQGRLDDARQIWLNTYHSFYGCLRLARQPENRTPITRNKSGRSNEDVNPNITFQTLGQPITHVKQGSLTNFGSGRDFDGIDPTKMAIVNAANIGGLTGGGIDRAITRAGGVELKADRFLLKTDKFGKRINVGGAVLTGPSNYGSLYVKNVIHAVGPNFYEAETSPTGGTTANLKNAYEEALRLCIANGITHVGFCPLSSDMFLGADNSLEERLLFGFTTITNFSLPPDYKLTVHYILYSEQEITLMQRGINQ